MWNERIFFFFLFLILAYNDKSTESVLYWNWTAEINTSEISSQFYVVLDKYFMIFYVQKNYIFK